MSKIGNVSSREVSLVTIANPITMEPIDFIDFLNSLETNLKGDMVPAKGGVGGMTRLSFIGSKEGEIKMTTKLWKTSLYKMLSGRDSEVGTAKVYKSEEKTVKVDTTATPNTYYIELSKTPVDGNGDGVADENDVKVVLMDNLVLTDSVVVDSLTVSGGKTRAYLNGVTGGDVVFTTYWYETASADAETITILAQDEPMEVALIIDSFRKEEGGARIVDQRIYRKTQLKWEISDKNSNSGDPNDFNMTFTVMPYKNEDREWELCTITLHNGQ